MSAGAAVTAGTPPVPGAGPLGGTGSGSQAGPGTPPWTSAVRLALHQVGYEQLAFWRNPQSVIFTFALPVMVIVIFGAVFGGSSGGDSFFYGLSGMQYFTPAIASLAIFGSCYAQLAVNLAVRRQVGVLKRLHATPLPAWAYFTGLVGHCLVLSTIDVTLIIAAGALYGVPLPGHWLVLSVTLVMGASCFCAIGVAVSSMVRDSEAASALVQFVQFPLLFVSGNYFPIHSTLVNAVAGVLPLRPFNQTLLTLFTGGGLQWGNLVVLLAWGAAGAAVAVRWFRWDNRRG